jgi:prepilin-type N-terminal cleavage/methylation domain-containing protein/prepilin-type processing-associated H-X9-DG protein
MSMERIRGIEMAHKMRRGFTLTELLVVIAVIGMLVALLMPAIQAARARARQTQCTNHQKELGNAMLQYTTAKQRYPGFANTSGESWVVALLPHLGHETAWKRFRSAEADVRFEAAPTLDQLVCPSDLDKDPDDLADPSVLVAAADVYRRNPLSYVVNRGICRNRKDLTENITVRPSDIPDPGVTVMISERRARCSEEDPGPGPYTSLLPSAVGFRWYVDRKAASPVDFGITEAETPSGGGPQLSSNHGGGVVVLFCDGHTDFLPEATRTSEYSLFGLDYIEQEINPP